MLRTFLGGVASALAVLALALVGGLETLELETLDRLFELRGARPPSAPIVIVTIDEDTFDELNLAWPFPRALHAQLVDRLAAARPLAIAFDVVFPEPSLRGPGDDEALGAAVARAGNVVLAAAITRTVEVVEGIRIGRDDPNLPVPAIRRGAAGVAPVNEQPDADGRLRRGIIRPRLGAELLDGWDVAVYHLGQAGGLAAAPLPAGDEILINFRGGPRSFTWVPYHRVLDGMAPAAMFRGAIVLIGATTPVLHDIFATPFARAGTMPGVEVHANVIDTLLRGDPIRAAPGWLSPTAAVVAAVGAAWLAARLRALRAFLVVLAVAAGLVATTIALFVGTNLWVRAGAPALTLVLGYGLTVVDNYIREQRERRRLSQFFSPAVLREIVRHRAGATLGSRRRRLTVLFSDIRGFTSISEKVEPEQVVEMLREYLTEMTEIVFRHGGTVDKYIGDCIMALYNVPFEHADHAAEAIRTALEFHERTLAVSARWEAKLGVQIRNGVGINTGEAVVGTMGSRQRLEYTAIGDTVNMASRLESLTKEHGTHIIISESTYEETRGRFLTRELGAVAVRGKSEPVKIYAVLPHDIRKHPRAALEAAATVTAVSDRESCPVRTRDISESGLSVQGLPEGWPVGARVQIRCEGGGLPKPIAADGVIVWRRDPLAGIAFSGLGPEAAPSITDYVANRTPP